MNNYYLKCLKSDVQLLQELAIQLGVLAISEESVFTVPSPYSGAWDVIGEVYREGETSPLSSEGGVPYWHANLRVSCDLQEVASSLAEAYPEIAEGLASISRWFVVDESGIATSPNNPTRVWL